MRVNFEKDAAKRELMWENQHQLAADKIYNMCADLGGFFLKVFLLLFWFLYLFTFLIGVFDFFKNLLNH